MKTGILIGYFSEHDEALKAFKKLRQKGFSRSALVSKNENGHTRVHDPFRPLKRFSVKKKLVEEHSNWLFPGETVLIFQGPIERLSVPFDLLLESGETPPALFALHPRYESPLHHYSNQILPPLTLSQLQEHAERLAMEHQLSPDHVKDDRPLEHLEQNRKWVQQVCLSLSEANRLQQSMPPAAEWLLDNEYILESAARDIQKNLPDNFYKQLPPLASGQNRGLPRVYDLAQELAFHSDLRLDEENVLAFIEAYQTIKPLSIGELWAMPQMLRSALLEGIAQIASRTMDDLREHEMADFWANRLITANRRDPNYIFPIMSELSKSRQNPNQYFATQLIDYLYDESSVLGAVQGWLERTFHKNTAELGQQVAGRQTRDQLSIGNAFISLRQLAFLDWKKCFERISLVEQTLSEDPAGIYPKMDFATRDCYRRAVEDLKRGSSLTENEVASFAIEMSIKVVDENPSDELSSHVGTYLIGKHRALLAAKIKASEKFAFRARRFANNHHTGLYLFSIFLFTAAFIFLAQRLGLAAILLLIIPASQISIEMINHIITQIFIPKVLPKMDFKDSGIPDACRTLIVVPMMFTDIQTISDEVEKLEVRYLANPDSNLLYGLFSDFADFKEPSAKTDEEFLNFAIQGISSLNQRHNTDRFFLFHRGRRWCNSEQRFIGWERKRGKLEELNGLIDGTSPSDASSIVKAGRADQLKYVRFIITLDCDTQLPHETARKLIETISHPLNQPHIDDMGLVKSGYAIIQPRVSPSLPSTNGSAFSRLFSDPIGIDPYSSTVSDVYQDLAGEGSYHGKGIYDVHAFNKVLSGRFPEELLLSHDLIEGAHARVGLASDIELYDEYPQDYTTYAKRQHRWIRGDWQIADWVTPIVPTGSGKRGPNPLTWFNRWKIFDNLRRSLLPIANLFLLTTSWSISPSAGYVATAVVIFQLAFHCLAQPVTWGVAGQCSRGDAFLQSGHDMIRALVEAALLPYQAWNSFDAIVKVTYRRCISHKKLLEWTSSQKSHAFGLTNATFFALSLGFVSLVSAIVALAVFRYSPESLSTALPWLSLWFLSPLAGWVLNKKTKPRQAKFMLPSEDRQFLRTLARRTWRYFSDFVDENTSWLPPDNYQFSHQNQLAFRTSPTNIGLYLVSIASAHDFGYLTLDQVAQKLSLAMDTIQKLERYEGHLLNWYDIRTLDPLKPRYVSTVDSGNLLGSLWTLEQKLGTLLNSPLLDSKAFYGLQDTLHVLLQLIRDGKYSNIKIQNMAEILNFITPPPASVSGMIAVLKQVHLNEEDITAENINYWIQEASKQVAEWKNIADRYLTWMEILDEKTIDKMRKTDSDCATKILESIGSAPSLIDLASGNVSCIGRVRDFLKKTPEGEDDVKETLLRVIESFDKSKWLAGEMLASIQRIIKSGRSLSDSINMNFLYSTQRRLFSIGYNVSEGRLDRSYYDLLASEARLGSFVAIARGDIPLEHWFTMNRPYGVVGRKKALLSWTGTMFEYLMPLLFQRSYENSLLDKSTREAVEIQIAYGTRHKVPWGISECAFGELDVHKTYQYYAFGVPDLALKRETAKRIVVAPYATMLAINISPKESVKNLKQFSTMGLLTDYGYYEALDFKHKSSRTGKRGVTVRVLMAHHQGMSFLSLVNFLHDNSLERHFHADPRVRSAEFLLQERIPNTPPLNHISTRERVSSVASVGDVAPAVSQFDTPHTTNPKTHLFCNSRYGLMVTNSGGGFSRWKNFEITRWRSDRTKDLWGTFCYIRDVDTNNLWCNTYHPTCGKVSNYYANFTLDRAMFHRVDHEIESETEIVVVPEDDVEIRRITLINRSQNIRRLDITSYMELSLSPHEEDVKHPAFNKLFIQTEALQNERTLLAHRRSRGNDDVPIFAAHRLTFDEYPDEDLSFETDRRRFIGRGRTVANPMAAYQDLTKSQGSVLDPIFSLRRRLNLAPKQKFQFSLVLAAGESRKQVMDLMTRYSDSHVIEHAMDLVWVSAQLELRLFHIQPDDARCFQQMASHLLYPNPMLRSSSERIAHNRKGQSGLWAYSISGDLPIALVIVEETRDIMLVRQMLNAHSYWRAHGLAVDLVILNEESDGYMQPLREQLELLIQSQTTGVGIDQPGGVFLRSAKLIPTEDLTLLRAVASIVIVAARGTLPQQLSAPVKVPEIPKAISVRRAHKDASAALPFMELPFFNSIGGFTPDGKEYAIYLGPNINTPAPWVNVIANPNFGTLISETGAGFTWAGNSQLNRLTPWSNDPVTDPVSEAIYIRDEETGKYWTPTAAPIRETTAYRARHGAGYTSFEHNSHGIEQNLTVFVPMDDAGGKPIKLQRLLLKNDTSRARKISVTYYAEWTLGESRESSQSHVISSWDEDSSSLMAQNFYNTDFANRISFASLSAPATSFTSDRTAFIGRNRSMSDPAAMNRVKLSRRIGAGYDPCAALQTTFKILPGETACITCMLGEAGSKEEVRSLIYSYHDDLQVLSALEETKSWWDEKLGAIEVHTPELSIDFMVNRWLLYQNISCRMWARSAFYQSSGAYGFRDQLQDSTSLLYSYPSLARDHILHAASRQFKEGDVQHWWHPPKGEGIRSRISDDLLWLPFVVAHYIRVTGDSHILSESVPWLDAPLLKDDQRENIQQPNTTQEKGTIFEHCQRALTRSQSFGPHGLPLMGTGDWNDGMNLVGAKGKGESVWLAWFMVKVLEDMAEMSSSLKKPDLSKEYTSQRSALIEKIEKFAWDGKWYMRATFDDGSLMGSSSSAEAQIDSLPQSWAVISKAADRQRMSTAIDSAWEHLVREDDGLTLLFNPPFEKSDPSPGYIKGYPPGVRENGGQYTHAALWLSIALARMGDGTRAAKILRMLNPIERAKDSEGVWRYGVEPYVVAADIYSAPEWIGHGGWTWYTGSASWMYRALVEEILGLKVRGDIMSIEPVIPSWWDGFKMIYKHFDTVYEIQVDNSSHVEASVAFIEFDGKRLKKNSIPLLKDFAKHKILVKMGAED